jgi:uncharacterized tellurite resistance protein B-like protein
MIAKISAFFQNLNEDQQSTAEEVSVEMACTVLLCEVMRADGHLDQQEQTALNQMISQHFSLNQEEVTQLINQALSLSEEAIDFHQFTTKINRNYSAKQKTEIVCLLWKLAISDGEIASIEEHIIRRIANLLHLKHGEYIAAKNSVKKLKQ